MDGLNGLLLPPESRPVASVQKEGFECDVCSKVLSSKNNLKVDKAD